MNFMNFMNFSNSLSFAFKCFLFVFSLCFIFVVFVLNCFFPAPIQICWAKAQNPKKPYPRAEAQGNDNLDIKPDNEMNLVLQILN